MRNVALPAVIGLFIAAAPAVGAPPVARADVDFYCRPGCWGAIAASTSTGQVAIRQNYRTRNQAEDAAVLWCDVTGKTNDCEVIISGLGCLSVAESGDGKTLAGRQAFFQDAADAAALEGAGAGSKIDLNGCSG
ncbi:DUF4189 domain-containing protein [Mycobacterium terramassiliense]|nr:DUF4189 domain-containing protein [Mycobacterium terramassiliense]